MRKITSRTETNLKIPAFRFLISSEVGWQLRFVSLETSLELLQDILRFLDFVSRLLHLNHIPSV